MDVKEILNHGAKSTLIYYTNLKIDNQTFLGLTS